MNIRTLAVAWFRQEDWPAWLAIDPEFQPDYDHWLKRSEQAVLDHADPRYVLEKVAVDPDDFLEWSRTNAGGNVGQHARAGYAAVVLPRQRQNSLTVQPGQSGLRAVQT